MQSSTFKPIGKQLRGRSCTFNHNISANKASGDVVPTVTFIGSNYQSASQSSMERDSALNATRDEKLLTWYKRILD